MLDLSNTLLHIHTYIIHTSRTNPTRSLPVGSLSAALNCSDSSTVIYGVWMSFCSTYLNPITTPDGHQKTVADSAAKASASSFNAALYQTTRELTHSSRLSVCLPTLISAQRLLALWDSHWQVFRLSFFPWFYGRLEHLEVLFFPRHCCPSVPSMCLASHRPKHQPEATSDLSLLVRSPK